AIDDLSFDPVETQPTPPAPDFALGYHSASPRLPVSTATPKTAEITINRFNGSTGAIAFSVADPGGWKVSFSPATATSTSVTMTVAAPDGAQAGDTRDLVVTATPTTPTAGSTPRQVTVPVAAVAAFVLRDIGTEQPDTCTRPFGLPVDRDFDFADPIDLSIVDPGPYNASISPATIMRPSQPPYSVDATITISPPPNAPDSGTVTVRGTSGAASFTRTIPV